MFAGRRFRVRALPREFRKRTLERNVAVPLGSFTGVVLLGRFTCLEPSFRVAGVALRDMWTCLAMCGKSFFVAGAILLQRFQHMRDTFSWQAQHFGLVTTLQSTPDSTFHTLLFTLYTLHSTLYILHSTLLHSTIYTLHSTLNTLHSTLHTLNSTIPTP